MRQNKKAMVQRLNKIHIEGYKSIKSLDIEIRDLNVLIGANGSGKSNFISLFKFLRQIAEQRLRVSVRYMRGAERILHYGSRETSSLGVTLDFLPNFYTLSLATTQDDNLFIEKEEVAYWNTNYKTPLWTRIGTGQTESELEKAKATLAVADYVYHFLTSWRVYHFHDTSDEARVKKTGKLNDIYFLREDASNLAAFLLHIRNTHPKHYERIVKTVQLVIPFFKDFYLQPLPDRPDSIQLAWIDKYSDAPFDAHDLSDGSLRFICLATLLLQPEMPSLILLDEPELGLHPAAIQILTGLLGKASSRTQVIVSTQSVNLVNDLEPEDIIVVDRQGGESKFSRLDSEQLTYWLNEYSLGEIWEKNIIGGRPSW